MSKIKNIHFLVGLHNNMYLTVHTLMGVKKKHVAAVQSGDNYCIQIVVVVVLALLAIQIVVVAVEALALSATQIVVVVAVERFALSVIQIDVVVVPIELEFPSLGWLDTLLGCTLPIIKECKNFNNITKFTAL